MISIRGAVTCENTKDSIIGAAKSMLSEMMQANGIEISGVLQIIFTATGDLDAAYPAVGARELGLTQAALMCVSEMAVPASLPSCIRAAMLCESNKTQAEARHVYLGEAKALRPDIAGGS